MPLVQVGLELLMLLYACIHTKAFSIFANAGSLAALLCVFASFLQHHTPLISICKL